MSKAILISINPKHVMNILNGKKTIELRKTYPHCALPIDVYIYCTKSNTQYLVGSKDKVCDILTKRASDRFSPNIENYIGNGKVVAKFTLNHVNMDFLDNVLKPACVTRKEAEDYLEGRPCWQWGIDNLVIFDKPMSLWQFKTLKNAERYKRDLEQAYEDDYEIGTRLAEGIAEEYECANCVELTELSEGYYGLSRAPQSWCYVDVMEPLQ